MNCSKLSCCAALVMMLAFGPCATAQGEANSSPRADSLVNGDGSTMVKASENYVIGPLDVIQFRILGEVETQTEVRVANDGSVSLPYVGNVKIAGMTVADARAMLYGKYSADYYVNPQIDLAIIAYKQKRVNVQGMVNRQGFVIFPPEEKVTLLGAIAMAGGWSDNRLASKTVKLVRTTDGTTKTTEIDTTKTGPEDCPLQDGDLVIVPERTW
jgi:polysaccharide biosynthesis/export protein